MIVLTPDLLARTADLKTQVRADRACGIGTLMCRYSLDRPTLLTLLEHRRINVLPINIEAVRGRLSTYGTYLIAHVGPRPDMTDNGLSHYAGTADIRLQVEAPPTEWEHAGTGDRQTEGESAAYDSNTRPDAYWKQAGGRTTNIEFDKGTYAPAKIRRKLEAAVFGLRPMIWGGPLPPRLHRVVTLHNAIQAERRAATRRAGRSDAPEFPIRTVLVQWHVWSRA